MLESVRKLENLFGTDGLPKPGTLATGPGPRSIEQPRVHALFTALHGMHRSAVHETDQAQRELGPPCSLWSGLLRGLGSDQQRPTSRPLPALAEIGGGSGEWPRPYAYCDP